MWTPRKGASVINCCYAARGIGVSSTTTKTVDCPDLTFSDAHRNVAGGKISLNVNRRVVAKENARGVSFLNQFIDDLRDSGFLRDSIGRANLAGVEVAPK
jgi:hypothetical protein